jgi:hypothetical protein
VSANFPLGVGYDSGIGRWVIFNQGGGSKTMPAGAAFNLYVVPNYRVWPPRRTGATNRVQEEGQLRIPGYQSRPAARWLCITFCLAALALPGCSPADGAWSGAISISRVGESTETTRAGTCCTDTTRRTLKDVVTVELVNNKATSSVSYNYAEHLRSRQAYDQGTFDITMDTVTAGSGGDSQRSRVSVSLAKDGYYEIAVDVPSVDGTWTQDGTSILTCNYPPPTCSPANTQDHRNAPVPGLSGASEVLDGQMTPGGPAVLSGSKTEQFPFDRGGEGTLTVTISWNLVRK